LSSKYPAACGGVLYLVLNLDCVHILKVRTVGVKRALGDVVIKPRSLMIIKFDPDAATELDEALQAYNF
jgi:hypothetical protein